MNDVTASTPTSDTDEKAAKRIDSAKQKFNRLFNSAVEDIDSLSAHARSTSGILTEDNASILYDTLAQRINALKATLDSHVSAPANVKKKAKPVGMSLF